MLPRPIWPAPSRTSPVRPPVRIERRGHGREAGPAAGPQRGPDRRAGSASTEECPSNSIADASFSKWTFRRRAQRLGPPCESHTLARRGRGCNGLERFTVGWHTLDVLRPKNPPWPPLREGGRETVLSASFSPPYEGGARGFFASTKKRARLIVKRYPITAQGTILRIRLLLLSAM